MYSLQSFSPRSILLSLLVCTFFVSGILGYGEPDNNGHPNWQERADHVLMNAVRMAPLDYRSKYASDNSPSMSSILTSYPAVAPVYLDSSLGTAALAHSVDMGTHNCFSHASCDGTETFTRIKSYYTCSGTMAENIAAGVADPRKVLNMLVCDSTGSACAADKSSGDGHRKNIMGSGYNAVGIGYGATSGSTYTHYWTQDFGGATCPAQTSPVYGGSHIFQTSGKTKFLANYYQSSNTAPTAARVVIDGTAVTMTLDIGTAGKGTYILEQTSGSACRSYYFEFVDASGTYRYPTAGSLVTYGEGQCSTSYTSDASVTSVPTTTPTTAPTSAPTTVPTTKAPTSAPTSAPTTKAPTSAPTSAPTTKAPTSAPTTQTPTSAPTTKAPTAAPTTKAPTSAPTTKAPTSAPTTKAPTSAPTTKAPTSAPTTKAPTSAPTTKAPTTTPTTARPTTTQPPTSPPTTRPPTTQPPTSVPTTVPATDAPGTAAPCVPSEIYSEIYSDGLKNGWTATADNIAGDLSLDCSADFVNHTGICLNMSANGYLKFARIPAIINNYDFFEFIARTDYANVTVSVSFEGVNCDNNVVDVTPVWTVYRFSMDTLQAPDVIGNPTTLVIKYEEEEDAPTLHIAEVQFVRIPIYN